MTTFLIIRHGHSTAGQRLVSRNPGITLSEEGIRQAEQLAGILSGRKISRIYSSPMERTKMTADIIAKPHALLVTTLDDVIESEFGRWSGKTFDELESEPKWKLFHTFRSGTRPPGGEHMSLIQARMVNIFETLRENHPDETIAVVSHGDPIRSLICYYMGMPLDFMLRFTIDTASLSIITVSDYGPEIRCINYTGQMPPEF